MKYLAALFVLLLVTGCEEDASPLTPFQCRVNGVMVEDSDVVTGIIVEEIHFSDSREIRAACMRPFSKQLWGCTIALAPGRYRIIYSNRGISDINYVSDLQHERCHAFYEEGRHMD